MDRVNAVTVDDIQRVARLYLKPDRLSVVLVGNAAGFTDQLKGIGSSFGTRSDADARGQRGRVVVVPFMRRKPTRAEKGDQGRA